MKYFIIAGEVSGDMHGSQLVKQLNALDNQAIFKGVGGEYLQQANVELLFGLKRLSFMGFYEVIKNLFTIRKNFKEIKEGISSFQPDVVILIDYPGFNLRMAKWCKKHGFKVVYYISPKFWAWNEKRVEKVKKYVDLMLCILPFEKDFYVKHAYLNTHYVGHPLLDSISEENLQIPDREKSTIALLPGSRVQEISVLLPLMLETAAKFPDEKFKIIAISKLKHLYPDSLAPNVSKVYDAAYKALGEAKAAIVCSGTATLETAIFQVPQVVVYKTSFINYQIGKRLAKVRFISLPNLIVDDKLVEELIQQDCTIENFSIHLERLLKSRDKELYTPLIQKLGERGASERAAQLITTFLKS